MGREYLKKHGTFLSGEVFCQDVPQPDNDTVVIMKSSIINRVLPAGITLSIVVVVGDKLSSTAWLIIYYSTMTIISL